MIILDNYHYRSTYLFIDIYIHIYLQNSTTSTSGSIALPTMMMIPRPPQAAAKLRVHSEVELINKYPFHAYSAYCSSDDFLNRSTHSEASHDELYELKDSSLHRQVRIR